MGQTPWSAVINLSNSIIGVSVLAMPWCFKECGIILAVSLLLITVVINKFSCNLLLRASKATRKTSYESLAHHTLGGLGKITVELSVILLLMCTCTAFFVIIGDLGPSLVSKFTGYENSWNLRTIILLGTAIFIILPLSQKRNIESLSGLSTISICFYFLFATSVFIDSLPKLLTLDWINDVTFWRPAGLLKGMSIFALSMCCQPTLFAVYNSLQERTPKQMEDVVSKGVNLVVSVYMSIGFFGYITYYTDGIKGDVLLNQPPSVISDALKFSFALSVALSFPLCVFPCRSSIFSLLFPNADSNPITGMTYIPPNMFRAITFVILTIVLIIAILIPNVEVVLSLTGSTMGSLACFIMPALIYQHAIGVPARFMPKVLLIIGITFMLFSTYDNIRPTPHDTHVPAPVQVFDKLDKVQGGNMDLIGGVEKAKDVDQIMGDKAAENMGLQGNDVIKDKEKDADGDVGDPDRENNGRDGDGDREVEAGEDKRLEPPIPHAPIDNINPDKEKIIEDVKKQKEKEAEDEDLDAPEKKEEKDEAEVDGGEKEKDQEEAVDGEDVEKRDIDDETGGDKENEAGEEAGEQIKVQGEKQEQQEKKLEELQVRQAIQERLIVKQAEEIDKLKKEHEDEKINEEVLQAAAVQLAQAEAAQQMVAQQAAGQPVQIAQGQVAQQPVQVAQGQQPVLMVQQQQPVGQGMGLQPAVGQPVAGGQVMGQIDGQLMGAQLGLQQQPMAGQPVAGQPQAGQLGLQQPAGQAALGQLPIGQGVGQPLVGQGQQQQQFVGQQPLAAAGQPIVQVGMQAQNELRMASMFPRGAGAGGMGQNMAAQQGLGQNNGQHGGMGGIPQQQQQQQMVQAGIGGGIGVGGMQGVAGGGLPLGQANVLPQVNVAQQVPLALQQQQLQPQQPLQQQQQLLQQPLIPQQQQQVPVVQDGLLQQPIGGGMLDPLLNQQQPLLQVVPDAGQAVGGVAAMDQQHLPQDGGGVVAAGGGGGGVGVANAGLVNMNQAQGGGDGALEGGIPQQQHEVS